MSLNEESLNESLLPRHSLNDGGGASPGGLRRRRGPDPLSIPSPMHPSPGPASPAPSHSHSRLRHDSVPDGLHELLPAPPESLDFDMWESRVNLMYNIELLSRGHVNSILKWVFILLIGGCTAGVAVFIDYCVKHLSATKLEILYDNVQREHDGVQPKGYGFLIYTAFQVGFVLIACCTVVFGEPMAAGSGIPEIKTMLNGIKVPNAVTLKALCCKVLGVAFSVAGGLPRGKEGPMIHSGSLLRAGIPLGKLTHTGLLKSLLAPFRKQSASSYNERVKGQHKESSFDLSFKYFQVRRWF